MNKLKIESINTSPSQLQVWVTDEDISLPVTIDYDGCIGEFTREEWAEDENLLKFDQEGQDEILDYLEMSGVIK